MRVVSPLLKHVLYSGLSRSGYLRRLTASAPAVVTYHGLLPRGYHVRDAVLDGHLVTAHAFVQQLHLLNRNYNVISPAEFLGWSQGEIDLPRRSVLLTCDDGLQNTLTDMLPFIVDAQLPFLFFVTGASAQESSSMLWYEQMFLWLRAADPRQISKLRALHQHRTDEGLAALQFTLLKRLSALAWDARKDALEDLRTRLGISEDWEAEYSENEPLRRRFYMLNRAELNQLRKAGVAVGAHTVSHPMLSQMGPENALNEIAASRCVLESALGEKVWALAYPFGNPEAVSRREEYLAQEAGFNCAFMNVEDAAAENRFAYPRIHVSAEMSVAELDAHVSGVHASIRKLASAARPA